MRWVVYKAHLDTERREIRIREDEKIKSGRSYIDLLTTSTRISENK